MRCAYENWAETQILSAILNEATSGRVGFVRPAPKLGGEICNDKGATYVFSPASTRSKKLGVIRCFRALRLQMAQSDLLC